MFVKVFRVSFRRFPRAETNVYIKNRPKVFYSRGGPIVFLIPTSFCWSCIYSTND
jgi:hypothetical protein